jgi:hypothetical protein
MSRFSRFEGEDAYAKAMGKKVGKVFNVEKVDFENNRVKINKALVSTKSKGNGVHCGCSAPEECIKNPPGVPKWFELHFISPVKARKTPDFFRNPVFLWHRPHYWLQRKESATLNRRVLHL